MAAAGVAAVTHFVDFFNRIVLAFSSQLYFCRSQTCMSHVHVSWAFMIVLVVCYLNTFCVLVLGKCLLTVSSCCCYGCRRHRDDVFKPYLALAKLNQG